MSSHRNQRVPLPSHSPATDHHAIVDAVTQLVSLLNESPAHTTHATRTLRHETLTTIAKLSASSLPGYIGPSFTANNAATVVAATVDVQASAGYGSNPPASPALTTAPRGAHLLVQAVSTRGDGMDWFLVQYTAARTAINGWVPITDRKGMRLLAPSAVASALHVRRPLAEHWVLSQGWGAWPELYRQITYDGVPLKGHNGLDFAAPVNTPVFATADGVVKRVDFEAGGFGKFILLEHAWGESLYAHLAEAQVSPQMPIKAGQPLGLSGQTGRCYGAHLHFGIRLFPYRRTDGWGGFCDPTPFLDPATVVHAYKVEEQPDLMPVAQPEYQQP